DLRGRNVVITGVAGTIGQALLQRVVAERPRGVHGLDIDRAKLGRLAVRHRGNRAVTLSVADVRDPLRLREVMAGAQIVFHAAAMKDVGACERDPAAAAETNVAGTRNVLAAARDAGAFRLVYTSTDKAVHPSSVMGATKLLGERLVSQAQADAPAGSTWSTVRFVNVLGSSASVVPVFHEQIRNGGPVTVTDPRMTRFVMSLRGAISLILQPLSGAAGGEIFLPKSNVMCVGDLAAAMIGDAASDSDAVIGVETIGARFAEKIHEELVTPEEAGRILECDRYYVVPAHGTGVRHDRYDGYVGPGSLDALHSGQATPMSHTALRAWLGRHGLLPSCTARLAAAGAQVTAHARPAMAAGPRRRRPSDSIP
ncbi:MAG TPA: polysaccharide biosynthesis protein, partial [Longimicrobium sp.]